MGRLLVIDTNNVLSRAKHAAYGQRVEMSSHGENTAALVIFITTVAKYVRMIEPTHVLACWDSPGQRFRNDIYPEYKANRKVAVDVEEIDSLWDRAITFLHLAGIEQAAYSGLEADDLIAEAVRHFPGESAIVSGDKDLLQLVSETVVQYRIPDDEPWTPEHVRKKFGCSPDYLPMLMALTGDTSDNIPGVRGIGPKKAAALLGEAEWNWTAAMTLLGPEREAQAVLSRRLVDLTMVPEVEFEWTPFEAVCGTHPGWFYLDDFFSSLEMEGLRSKAESGDLWSDERTVALFEDTLD